MLYRRAQRLQLVEIFSDFVLTRVQNKVLEDTPVRHIQPVISRNGDERRAN